MSLLTNLDDTFAHAEDLRGMLSSINNILDDNGVFIFEEPYLGSMFEKTSYDQIYDEHIFMFSGSAIQKIFSLFDMELIDLIKQPTHGGSMRYVIARKGIKQQQRNVQIILDQEKHANLDNYSFCEKFRENCENSKMRLKKLLLKTI